jgi:hypothetical protein
MLALAAGSAGAATTAPAAKAKSAAPAASPLPAEPRAAMLRGLHEFLDPVFKLDPALALDPALRKEAETMAAAHLTRVDGLLRAWIDDEAQRASAGGKQANLRRVFNAVMARMQNELALWQIEPGDADYERATLDVLRTAAPPGVCPYGGDPRFSDYGSRMLRIQAMPAAARGAALAAERTLLGHWGQARAALPDWPDPLPQDAALAWLRPAQSKGVPAAARREGLALPPILASQLLGLRADYQAMSQFEQCALQQWWLRESLRQGAAPAAALNAFRYGTAVFPASRFAGLPQFPEAKYDPAVPTPPYPKLASEFGVTGTTSVRVRLDPAGKPLGAAVERRDVKVDGIRGVRAVAFEDVFDKVVLDYTMARTFAKPKDGEPYRYQYVWSLEETPATPSSGEKR